MCAEGIVSGQKVTDEKLRLSRELRRRMTPEEHILWKHLRGHRLQGLHFRRQQIIDGSIVDFYCHAACLVVEVDGEVHKAQAAYDAERDCALRRRGLRVLRIPNEDVRRDTAAVLACIAALAAQPGAPVAPSQAPVAEAEPADETQFPCAGGTVGGSPPPPDRRHLPAREAEPADQAQFPCAGGTVGGLPPAPGER